MVFLVFILPILGLGALILDSISTFTYLDLFMSRPEYEYSLKPSNPEDNHVYVLSLEDCKTNITESLFDLVNGLSTKYYTGISIMCFIFSVLSLIATQFVHILEFFYECKDDTLKYTNIISIIFSILSFLFSTPAVYALKIEYKDCLVLHNNLEGYCTKTWAFVSNFGLWSSIIFPILHYFCKMFYKDYDNLKKDQFLQILFGFCLLLICSYLIMAVFTKFGASIIFKLPWDICLSLNLVIGIISHWQNYKDV